MTKKSRTTPTRPPLQTAAPVPVKRLLHRVLLCALIAAATFIAFFPSLRNGFTNWDDDVYVTNNPDIRHIDAGSVKKLFTSTYSANYQPVTMLVYALEYGCFGPDPAGYHWINLLLHMVNGILVFVLIFRLSGNTIAAFVTALLFAIHPLHVESVAWVAECKDVVATLFFLLSLLFYLRFTGRRNRSFPVAALAALILSLLSKSTAVSEPFVLLLIDYFRTGKITRAQVVKKLPFFVCAGAFAVLTLATQKHVDVIRSIPTLTPAQRIGVPFYGIVFYLLKSVAPVHLCALYSYPPVIDTWLNVRFGLSVVAVLLIAVIVFRNRTRSASLVFGSLFFLVTALPMLQIVQVGNAMTAERYTYIPLIGIFFLCGAGIAWLFQKKTALGPAAKRLTGGALAAAAALFMYLSYHRCEAWRDSLTLWNDIIEKCPSTPAYYNRGTTLLLNHQCDRAAEDLTRAIAGCPTLALAYSNRGAAYYMMGRYELAIADFNAALALKPDYSEARYDRDHAIKVFEEKKAAASAMRR